MKCADNELRDKYSFISPSRICFLSNCNSNDMEEKKNYLFGTLNRAKVGQLFFLPYNEG